MNEHTKPELLDESALQEIEAINQRCRYPYVDALCQTVRALRGQYESAISDFAVEINALREQLTEARTAAFREATSAVSTAFDQQPGDSQAWHGNTMVNAGAMERRVIAALEAAANSVAEDGEGEGVADDE